MMSCVRYAQLNFVRLMIADKIGWLVEQQLRQILKLLRKVQGVNFGDNLCEKFLHQLSV